VRCSTMIRLCSLLIKHHALLMCVFLLMWTAFCFYNRYWWLLGDVPVFLLLGSPASIRFVCSQAHNRLKDRPVAQIFWIGMLYIVPINTLCMFFFFMEWFGLAGAVMFSSIAWLSLALMMFIECLVYYRWWKKRSKQARRSFLIPG